VKPPLHKRVVLIATHPAGLLAVDKPEGVRSHPNVAGKPDSLALLAAPYDPERECYAGTDGASWYLLNRLDAPTSGVLLLATDAGLAAVVRAAFEAGAVRKTYLAVVRGWPARATEVWRDRLSRQKVGGQLRVVAGRGGDAAETVMRRLAATRGPPTASLLELEPRTGRSHQLRVQAAARQLPIVGDATYGDFGFNRQWAQRTGIKRLLLHSWRTELTVEWRGDPLEFKAEAAPPIGFEPLPW
jgi:tRNA pseudouridine65 synthase